MLDKVEQAQFIERNACINCGSSNLADIAEGSFIEDPILGFLNSDPWGEHPLPFLQSATWHLTKCRECNQIFHRNVLNAEWNERRFTKWMSADAIVEFENRLGPRFQRAFQTATGHVEHIFRIEALTRTIRNSEPVRLLDFGCGFGSFLETSARFGFEIFGVDRSVGRRSKASISIASSLDELSGKFHAITLFEVLEHLDAPIDILKQLAPLVLPGGVLVLETPDCEGLTGINTGRDFRLADPLEHINCFTHDTLKSIVKRAGFKHIKKPTAFATSEPLRATKRFAKYILGKEGRSTQLYFRKP
jgi:2-polyprenyl-3-methyl-5-hydroxy-6-metoxy-1,4-benzoquinol methylase